MIQIKPLGETANPFPATCDPRDARRKRFSEEGVTLIVPSYLEDEQIRWLIDRGDTMFDAYKRAGCSALLPTQGLRACVSAVLRTKYYDRTEKAWKITGGQFTCIGFGKCFADYLVARRTFESKRGRIKVAEGIYSPSPTEEECIMRQYTWSKNLPQAYSTCGASDILPAWPGAIESISGALNQQSGASMYAIIDTLYKLSALVPPADQAEPPTPEGKPPKKPTEKKPPYVLLLAAGIGIMLVTKGR